MVTYSFGVQYPKTNNTRKQNMNKPDYCPEWFDLDNYESCKKFTRNGWDYALNKREHLFFEEVNAILEKYRKNDCSGDKLKKTNELFRYISSKEAIEAIQLGFNDDYEKPHIVKDLNAELFAYLYWRAKEDVPEYIDFLNKGISIIEDNYLSKAEFTFNVVNYIEKNNIKIAPISYCYAPISVDISGNDERLIEDFKCWLASKREEQKKQTLENSGIEFTSAGTKRVNSITGEKFSDTDLRKLTMYKVLPYIDLYIWGVAIDREFSDIELANLLFPHDFTTNHAERIRLTIAPFAKAVLFSQTNPFI